MVQFTTMKPMGAFLAVTLLQLLFVVDEAQGAARDDIHHEFEFADQARETLGRGGRGHRQLHSLDEILETAPLVQVLEITNLAFMQPFSSFFIMSHDPSVEPPFTIGQPPSPEFAMLAENGDPGPLVTKYHGMPGVRWAGAFDDVSRGPFNISLPLMSDTDVISIASMLVNTNDGFVGMSAQASMTEPMTMSAWDAGSEENNEMCASIPGPACRDDSGNVASGDGEGLIHIHRGIYGIGHLARPPYSWRNPVATVTPYLLSGPPSPPVPSPTPSPGPLGLSCGDQSADPMTHITAWNTFTDPVSTGGAEFIYDIAGPTPMSNGIEFNMFPSTPPDMNSPTGFYDIDFTTSSIVYTLRDNTNASHLVFTEGSFDRYYYDLGAPIMSASIVSSETGISATVDILEPGFSLSGPSNGGIAPLILPNGGLRVSVVPGADISVLGRNIVVCYQLAPRPLGAVCGDQAVDPTTQIAAWNTFTDSVDTGGMEFIYDYEGPTAMSSGVEFNMFPSTPPNMNTPTGFYDIDFSTSSIIYTLRDNTNASHLVFPTGSYDRYYFDLGAPVASASIVSSESQINAYVDVLQPGFVLNSIGNEGIPPLALPLGGIRLTVAPGADISVLGSNIVVCYELGSPPPALGLLCGNQAPIPNSQISAWNSFTDAVDTGGVEFMYDFEGPVPMSNNVEVNLFPSTPPDGNTPPGFYDIDFTSSSIIYTLRFNMNASHAVFPSGTFDRYYFDLGVRVTGASVVSSQTEINSFVEVLAPGFTHNTPGDPSLPPLVLPNGGLRVTIFQGADLSVLGRNIVVCYAHL